MIKYDHGVENYVAQFAQRFYYLWLIWKKISKFVQGAVWLILERSLTLSQCPFYWALSNTLFSNIATRVDFVNTDDMQRSSWLFTYETFILTYKKVKINCRFVYVLFSLR